MNSETKLLSLAVCFLTALLIGLWTIMLLFQAVVIWSPEGLYWAVEFILATILFSGIAAFYWTFVAVRWSLERFFRIPGGGK